MNPVVALLWWMGLLAALVAFLPNLIAWLDRTLAAAHHTERYSEEILMATRGIAANTRAVSGLQDTLAAAQPLSAQAEAMERHVAEIQSATAPSGEGRGAGPEAQP